MLDVNIIPERIVCYPDCTGLEHTAEMCTDEMVTYEAYLCGYVVPPYVFGTIGIAAALKLS